MKKMLLVLLTLLAIPLYSYNIYLLVRTAFPPAEKKNTTIAMKQSFDQLLLHSRRVVFEKSGKSPFSPYKEKPLVIKVTPPVKNAPPKAAPPKKEVTKPAIKITGMMWSPSNPVAMVTLPDGSNTVVKEGGVYGAVTVKKIEQKRIQVIYEKNSHWIDR